MLYALYIWIYLSLNIEKLRYKLNMKARLTFNSDELTGHRIIVVIFLESMQETVHVKIKSSTLVKLFSSSSSRAMGSAPIGVRCQFHQLPPSSSVRRHLTQFLKRHPAHLIMSSSHSLCDLPLLFVSSILPNISSFIFLLCILHMCPNSPSFLPISFCKIFSFSCIRPYRSVFFTFCVHPILSIFL